MMVEQHIAHERVIYERLLAQQSTAGRTSEHSQRLVISAPLTLTAAQRSTLTEHIESLRKLGFDFDVQGDLVACTQVPLELATKDYASSVQANVEQLLTAGQAEFELEATKSVACQAAVKDGMPLSESEIIELLSEWSKCPRNDTCPHGRPIALTFSKDKLFQMFHPD
jgi:DNA mismatch repair protein MutL